MDCQQSLKRQISYHIDSLIRLCGAQPPMKSRAIVKAVRTLPYPSRIRGILRAANTPGSGRSVTWDATLCRVKLFESVPVIELDCEPATPAKRQKRIQPVLMDFIQFRSNTLRMHDKMRQQLLSAGEFSRLRRLDIHTVNLLSCSCMEDVLKLNAIEDIRANRTR